jgi:hypothetical protein
MKTINKALILFFAVALSLPFKAALNPDSLMTVIKNQNVTIGQLTSKTRADSVSKADTIKKLRAQIPVIGECRSCEINWVEKLLVVLPAALFLCLAFYFLRWLKREKFKLGDALGSDVPDSFITNRTTTTDAANPALTTVVETTEPNYSKSSSRLIAFLTAISAIVIALSLITYYAYGYITQNGDMQNLDELWKIIAGLGIGVVPYIAKTIKGNETPAR